MTMCEKKEQIMRPQFHLLILIFDNKSLISNEKDELKKVKESYEFEGDACDKCGNFTLYKEKHKIKCLTCNHEYSE